ncbi:MAG: hypothetical protein IJ246_01260, partial [Clostridia bacterium]|nr:hypothetical protein [Clostridia bacterium]
PAAVNKPAASGTDGKNTAASTGTRPAPESAEKAKPAADNKPAASGTGGEMTAVLSDPQGMRPAADRDPSMAATLPEAIEKSNPNTEKPSEAVK